MEKGNPAQVFDTLSPKPNKLLIINVYALKDLKADNAEKLLPLLKYSKQTQGTLAFLIDTIDKHVCNNYLNSLIPYTAYLNLQLADPKICPKLEANISPDRAHYKTKAIDKEAILQSYNSATGSNLLSQTAIFILDSLEDKDLYQAAEHLGLQGLDAPELENHKTEFRQTYLASPIKTTAQQILNWLNLITLSYGLLGALFGASTAGISLLLLGNLIPGVNLITGSLITIAIGLALGTALGLLAATFHSALSHETEIAIKSAPPLVKKDTDAALIPTAGYAWDLFNLCLYDIDNENIKGSTTPQANPNHRYNKI